jgi:hypothetical protein
VFCCRLLRCRPGDPVEGAKLGRATQNVLARIARSTSKRVLIGLGSSVANGRKPAFRPNYDKQSAIRSQRPSALGRFELFAGPSANSRYLRIPALVGTPRQMSAQVQNRPDRLGFDLARAQMLTGADFLGRLPESSRTGDFNEAGAPRSCGGTWTASRDLGYERKQHDRRWGRRDPARGQWRAAPARRAALTI